MRHGETQQMVDGITQGQGIGGDLNNKGKFQAQQAALYLQDEHIDQVYCSDLKRAVDTAAEILKFHPDTPIHYTPELRERSLGIYEGRPKHEWKSVVEASILPFPLFKPINGESYEEVQERIYDFYNYIVAKHPKDTILLVTHGGTLGMLYLKLFQRPFTADEYERHRPENTAVTIGEFYHDKPIRIQTLNSIQHLLATESVAS